MKRQQTFFLILVMIIWSLLATTIHARIIFVPDEQIDIQSGVNAAQNGDIVVVRDGIYKGTRNRRIKFLGKAITVKSENGPGNCIVDCEHLGKGFFIQNYENSSTVLEGFTIRNGDAGMGGGGIYIINSSPIVANCIVENCYTNWEGGGICIENSNAQIIDCRIRNNISDMNGGGMYIENSQPRIFNCEISGNTAKSGGGMYCGSTGQYYMEIFNCLMHRNHSSTNGGGLLLTRVNANVRNCTIAGNTTDEECGGLLLNDGSFALTNSIICANYPVDVSIDYSQNPTISYCLSSGPMPGSGNIVGDPLFYSGPLGEYYLSTPECGQNQLSPCIDAGRLESWMECMTLIWGDRCLVDFTTRTDHGYDVGQADIGFHYTTDGQPPEPTPTPTSIPDCPVSGVTLEMPANIFHPGDICYLDAVICNASWNVLIDYVLMIALEAGGQYWLAPEWVNASEHLSYYRLDIDPGITEMTILEPFTWPEGLTHSGTICIWGACLTEDLNAIFGEMDCVHIQY